jgi:hypothetical protein
MKTILVAKTGGKVYFADQIHRQTPTSEQGATAGMLHHLCTCGRYRVVYHGLVEGAAPEGMTVVKPDILGLGYTATEAEMRRRCEGDLRRVEAHGPFHCWVNVAGYSPSWAVNFNPRHVQPLLNAMRYCGPQLFVAGELALDRIVLNADVRCYPREGEMSEMYSSLVPAALLTQVTRTWPQRKTVAGVQYSVREVECGMENWHTVGRVLPPPPLEKDVDLCVMSHAHVHDGFGKFAGRISLGRDAVWRKLLGGVRWTEHYAAVVYGEGWEGLDYVDPDMIAGPISPSQVVPELQRAVCGVVVTPWGDDPYVTSKVRYYAWAGCVPVMYGHGEWVPHMGDGVGRYVPLERGVPYRARDAEELRACVEYWRDEPRQAREYCMQLEVATRPRFDVLDEAIEGAPDWERFGGYRAQ